MANHKSALKRNRQNIKIRARNGAKRAEVRTYIKGTRTAIDNGEMDKAKEMFLLAQKAISKAAGHGLYHPKNASRKISRLAQAVSSSSSAN